jgi:hypothetical protein
MPSVSISVPDGERLPTSATISICCPRCGEVFHNAAAPRRMLVRESDPTRANAKILRHSYKGRLS